MQLGYMDADVVVSSEKKMNRRILSSQAFESKSWKKGKKGLGEN